IISLSAILLNDAYYELLVKGKRTVYGYSVVEIETVILLKIKAWLDMNQKQEKGENIDSKNIRKHKNDIFRLLSNVTPSSRLEAADEIKNDIKVFMKLIDKDRPDLKNLGIRNTSFVELMEIFESIFCNF
ncbi:MAG: hypothetical protein Q8S24_11600, partial [Eubacteriales bacterium]|nr:hypothetical protein [Eubacteriales bacterium]